MSIDSNADWRGLWAVGRVVRLTLDALARQTRPGVSTGELDCVAAAVLAARGARSAPSLVYGFPGTVLISVNDEVVHGIPGARRLASGDLVKLDVTVEKDGYIADAARTVIVGSGTDSPAAWRRARRRRSRPAPPSRRGSRVNEIGRAVEREVRRSGFSVIKGLTGHGVGRTIHEPPSVPNYYDAWQRDVLTEGLVVTIEPIITCGAAEAFEDADGWTLRTRDGSLAAHHEHTLVITRGRPVLLTAA